MFRILRIFRWPWSAIDEKKREKNRSRATQDHTSGILCHTSATQDHTSGILCHTSATQDHTSGMLCHTSATQDHTSGILCHTRSHNRSPGTVATTEDKELPVENSVRCNGWTHLSPRSIQAENVSNGKECSLIEIIYFSMMDGFHDIIVEGFVESCTGPFLVGNVRSDASLPPNMDAKESVGKIITFREYDSFVAPSSSSFAKVIIKRTESDQIDLPVACCGDLPVLRRGKKESIVRVPCGTIHFNAACSHERSAL